MSALVPSVHKAICKSVVALLKAAPTLAGGQVFANGEPLLDGRHFCGRYDFLFTILLIVFNFI